MVRTGKLSHIRFLIFSLLLFFYFVFCPGLSTRAYWTIFHRNFALVSFPVYVPKEKLNFLQSGTLKNFNDSFNAYYARFCLALSSSSSTYDALTSSIIYKYQIGFTGWILSGG